MEDLNSHYQLHWDFFKSINPKIDESFFVEYQIEKVNETLKKGIKEIDFSNDSNSTIEDHVNEMEKENFFFQKHYLEFLERKLTALKNKEEVFSLPPIDNIVTIHYGCSDFKSESHIIYWIGAVAHNPNKVYFFENRDEVQMIEKLKSFTYMNKDKVFIHWSMNSPKFGFSAIQKRYFDLTNKEIDLFPKNEIDLSEYLKNKYGVDYVERENGRLNNIARLNNFSGVQSEIEVINLNDGTNRLELIYSIVQAEIQGKLKTLLQNIDVPALKAIKPEKKKRPPAKDVYAAFKFLDDEKRITQKECKEMLVDARFEFISKWLFDNWGYNFKGSSLKKEQNSNNII
jgi:hypothetical protein